MRPSVRVLLFNTDEEHSASIRADLLSIPGVQMVGELGEIALLEPAVNRIPAEVLLAHLDPAPEVVLPVVAGIARSRPELAVLVLSESTDGQHILTAMRAGVKEFLTKPLDRQLLSETIQKVVWQTESSLELGQLISVLGTIGGAGASSLAVNLAVELKGLAKKRPVALVDLDFRYGHLGTMLDLQADYTIADLCDTPEQLDPAMIDKAMVKHGTGVHLLARPNQFAQADQITAAHCVTVLGCLQQLYEFVVVDGPNRFDPGGLSVIDLASVNLLVLQLLVTSVRNTHRMLEELREAGYNLERFRLVCNRVGRECAHLEMGHVEKTLNLKVAHQIPDDWKAMSAAINMGVPLIESAPKSKARLAIRELARKIADPGSGDQPEASRGGLFSKILSGRQEPASSGRAT